MSEDMNIFGAPNDDEAGDIVLNLSGDDLQDGSFKDIPDGTWVRVSIYDAQLGKVQKEGDNKGKPQAIFTFKLVGLSAKEYGPKTFRVWAQLYPGAFFTMYGIMKALKDELSEMGYELPSRPPNKGDDINIRVPHPSKLLGLVLEGRVKRVKGNKKRDDGSDIWFENLKGFRAAKDDGGTVSEDSAQLFTTGSGGLFE